MSAGHRTFPGRKLGRPKKRGAPLQPAAGKAGMPPLDPNSRTVQTTVLATEDLLARIDEHRSASGISRNEWMRRAFEARLKREP